MMVRLQPLMFFNYLVIAYLAERDVLCVWSFSGLLNLEPKGALAIHAPHPNIIKRKKQVRPPHGCTQRKR